MIPTIAMESANKAVYNSFKGLIRPLLVKVALEAAAPHIAAVVWDEAVSEGEAGGWLHDYAADDLRKRNPYRSQP